MSTKVPRPKSEEDGDLSPPRRRAATADHFSPPRRHDTSSSHRQNDRHSRQESSPPRFQPVKSERRCLTEHQEKIADRYSQWSHGLAQVRQLEDAVKDHLEQAEKPLSRYRDDKDLDTMLKQKERQGKF
jgi:hypothetical protein